MPEVNTIPLAELCAKANARGREIVLTGCNYGFHKRTQQHHGIRPYYYFLAGFVWLTRAKQILEIGTHCGGSTKALAHGLHPEGAKTIVSIDRNRNFTDAATWPDIKLVIGEADNRNTVFEVANYIVSLIDILFIDSTHHYTETLSQFVLYREIFWPRFALFDDIHLNPDMERFWGETKAQYGDAALDVSDIIADGIDDTICNHSGFGVVRIR